MRRVPRQVGILPQLLLLLLLAPAALAQQRLPGAAWLLRQAGC